MKQCCHSICCSPSDCCSLAFVRGQVNHFYNYAPEPVPYAQKRYLTEAKRLVTVLDKQLSQHTHVAGPDYSIADMAILPWVDFFVNNVSSALQRTCTHCSSEGAPVQ